MAKAAQTAIDPAIETRACPQCASEQSRPLPDYSSEPWRVVRCEECGFVYLRNTPTYRRMVDEFAWEKTSVAETARRAVDRPVLTRIDQSTRWRLKLWRGRQARALQRLFAPGRVLDVGCGWGTSVPEPFTPFGIEISRELARDANARMSERGGRVIHAPAIEGITEFPDRYFSGVLLASILEHEAKPKPLLQQVVRVLADGGKAYIRVPNYGSVNRRVMGAKWCGFRYPDHVNYFTLGSLRRMAADCGLRTTLQNPLLPFDDNIKAVLSKA